jgi:hypothetical protein
MGERARCTECNGTLQETEFVDYGGSKVTRAKGFCCINCGAEGDFKRVMQTQKKESMRRYAQENHESTLDFGSVSYRRVIHAIV